MKSLRDMPMISVDQKNRFREAALEVEEERDALATHLERLTHQIEGALRIKDLWLPFHCEPEHEEECRVLGKMCAGFTNALAEKPDTTSLARRDARMKAEAVEYAAQCVANIDGVTSGDKIAEELVGTAAQYRKQAEGES